MATKKQREKRELRYVDARAAAAKASAGYIPASIKIPDGCKFKTFNKEGSFDIDILPYIVGKGNPEADKDYVWWRRFYYIHRGLGANPKKQWVCPAETFGKKCAVCAYNNRENKRGTDAFKELAPKHREVMAFRMAEGNDPTIYIYEDSYYFGLGELIDKLITTSKEKKGYKTFYYLADGKSVTVGAAKNNRGFVVPSSVDFDAREEDLPEDLIDSVPCLDDLIVETPNSKLQELLDEGAPEEDDSDSKRGRDDDEEDEDEDVDDDEDEDDDEEDDDEEESVKLSVGDTVTYKKKECEVTKISSDGTSLTLKEKVGGKLHKGVDPEDVELMEQDDDEEDDEEVEDEPIEEDDDDDEDDEEDDDEDDEEEDEEDDDEDEEEDEKPVKRRKR
jgi:hypothetical protein